LWLACPCAFCAPSTVCVSLCVPCVCARVCERVCVHITQAHLVTVASPEYAEFVCAVVATGSLDAPIRGTWVGAARDGAAEWSWMDGTGAGMLNCGATCDRWAAGHPG
jgi:hypothetical protein